MDKINELIESENYQEALKLLLQLEGYYLEKIQCLFELEKYDELLSFYESIKNSLEDDYYEIFGYVINSLINKEEFDSALDLLNEELSMPYIPQNYEHIINDLYDDVVALKQVHLTKNNAYKLYDENNVKEILQHDNDYFNLFEIVNDLHRYNIRNLVESIQIFLKRNVSSILKSMVLEEYLNQEISQTLIVEKNNLEFEYLASSNTYVENDENYQKTIDILVDRLDKTPSFLEMALSIIYSYAYIIYPLTIDEDEILYLALIIEYYILTLNMENVDINYEDLGFSESMIEEGYEWLENILKIESEYENA